MNETMMPVVSVLILDDCTSFLSTCFSLSDSPKVQIFPSSDLPREGERFNLQCVGNSNPE